MPRGAGSTASSGCSARRRSSRPPTATSARRSTTRSASPPSIALGLTPLVFVITGVIFAATAATYAEGTVRYPEAGGSSSFARHAFNELVSLRRGLGADAHTTSSRSPSRRSSCRTTSRSSGSRCSTNPWDIVGGIVVIVVLVVAQHRRRQGGGAPERRASRSSTSPRSSCSCCSASSLVFSPHDAHVERPLGRRADLGELRARDPGGDDRLHRHRDRLEPRRGGARPRAQRAAASIKLGRDRRLRDLLHAAARSRSRRCRSYKDADGELRDAARRSPPERGRLPERPGARARREPRPARHAAATRRDLRRRARRDDPLHRHERGRDRRVADHVLDGDLPAAAGGLPPAAPALQDAVARRSLVFAGFVPILLMLPGKTSTSSATCTRSARCSRSPSRTPRSSRCAAGAATRSCSTGRGRTCASRGVDWPLFAVLGGLGTGARLARRRRPERADALGRPRLARDRLRRLLGLPAAIRARAADARRCARRSLLGPALALEYRTILVPVVDGPSREEAVDVACRLAAERGATIVAVRVIVVPLELPLDADAARAGASSPTSCSTRRARSATATACA